MPEASALRHIDEPALRRRMLLAAIGLTDLERCFWEQHPDSEVPPSRWFRIVRRSAFASFAALRATFPSADMVGDLVVFNIGGNRYRLVASVHFNRRKLHIRHVLTHAEYDKGAWRP